MGRRRKAPDAGPLIEWRVTWARKDTVKAETIVLAAASEKAGLVIAQRQVSFSRRRGVDTVEITAVTEENNRSQ